MWILLGEYKILEEREKLKRQLERLQAKFRWNKKSSKHSRLENKTFLSLAPFNKKTFPPGDKAHMEGMAVSSFVNTTGKVKGLWPVRHKAF